jgi:hypothetical protein
LTVHSRESTEYLRLAPRRWRHPFCSFWYVVGNPDQQVATFDATMSGCVIHSGWDLDPRVQALRDKLAEALPELTVSIITIHAEGQTDLFPRSKTAVRPVLRIAPCVR